MPKISAGILLFRRRNSAIEVLLVHPGGPFWMKKDAGAWSIPKGELDSPNPESASEAVLLELARREFAEELGPAAEGVFSDSTDFHYLGNIRQKSGKLVHAWAVEGDCDALRLQSNTFTLEWPPRSGKESVFPEVDRAEFFSLETARAKMISAQTEFLDRLAKAFAAEKSPS
ncbi:MAG TPA: NUDIX domain-containing protein [Candidatus Acidoferrales bacterium]|nr:NUDIX domain-containing protein [Candidatus Acidoferrales bacterium]